MKVLKTEACGKKLTFIETEKFKTELFAVYSALPYEKNTSRLINLLFAVLKQGCASYPSQEVINRRLDDLYDTNIATIFSVNGDNVTVGFSIEAVSPAYIPTGEDALGESVRLLRDILLEPLFDKDGLFLADIVETEKKILCDRVRAADNNPKTRSYNLCCTNMFCGEPYAERILGTVEEISLITPKILTDFYWELIKNISLNFSYIGRRKKGDIEKIISENFVGFDKTIYRRQRSIQKEASGEMRYIEEGMKVSQGRLTIGFRGVFDLHSKELYSVMLLNEIFGGSPASKLFRHVREEKSLCYSCSSQCVVSKGAIMVCSGIANENKDIVVEEIIKQLDEIKSGNISEFEFGAAKKILLNTYLTVNDSEEAIENYYRSRDNMELSATIEDTVRGIEAITPEDVIKIAARFNVDTCAFVRGDLDRGREYEEADDE